MEQNKKKKSFWKRILTGGFFVIFVMFLGGVGAVLTDRIIFPAISSKPAFSRYKLLKRLAKDVTVITKTEQVTIREDDSVSKVANRVSNSVVNILSIEEKALSGSLILSSAHPNVKNGTGVIITGDGMIVTYRTGIIEEEASYQVMLFDGGMVSANLVAIDEFTNLAFLKIESQNLPIVSLADENNVQAGMKLIYVGNSGSDYQNEFSSGLLSESDQTLNIAGKTVSSSEKLEGVYRVSGVESSRFTGGPAVTYKGEMIGIVGMITLNNERLVFTIPVVRIQSALNRAVQDMISLRPSLGVYYSPITRSFARAQALSIDHGALIYSPSGKQGLAVLAGSSAEKAGILVGDIVVKVDESEVNLNNPLSNLIANYIEGDLIKLTIIRDEKELIISVQL